MKSKNSILYLLISWVVLFVFFTEISLAQKEANNWYFGENAGINFNGNTPVALTNGALNTFEGCAAISDFNGNLLFYTDGITVYNKQHQIMLNGTGLKGDLSASQSGVIVRMPQSASRYYVFSVDNDGGVDGLRYSLIDISAQNGLGAVLQKNILLASPVTERITATLHANGQDIWVVTHGWQNDQYYAILINQNGVNPPVTSTIGTIHNGFVGNSRGCMKISPDGTRLATAIVFDGIIELFDFDNATGILTNGLNINGVYGAYGIEFSPDSKKIYASTSDIQPGKIFQFDLTNPAPSAIVASQTLIAQSASSSVGALQLGPDRRIYVARSFSDFLGVINYPDVQGGGCDYNDDGFYLNGKRSTWGLPTFVQSFFRPPRPEFNYTTPCLGDSTQFWGTATDTPDSWHWNFGDPASGNHNFSSLQQPRHLYSAPGVYEVTLIVEKFGFKDSVKHTVRVIPYPDINLGRDTIICDAPSFELLAGDTAGFYLWSTGQNSGSITVSSTAIYWLEAGNGACRTRDSIDVRFIPLNYVYVGDDRTICEGDTVTLNAGNAGAGYLWSTGATTQTIKVFESGVYSATVTAGNCQLSDTAVITVIPMPVANLGPDRSICADQAQLWAGEGDAYVWSTGATTPYIYISQSGKYTVKVVSGQCEAKDTVNITLLTPARVSLGSDLAICIEELEEIMIGIPDDNQQYSWSTGATTSMISVTAPGTYWLEAVSTDGCTARDEIVVYEQCTPRVYIPTAFSPNGDGVNDLFIIFAANVENFQLTIYDKWGKVYFVSNSPDHAWDGRFNQKPSPEGIYGFRLSYSTPEGNQLSREGSLTLLR